MAKIAIHKKICTQLYTVEPKRLSLGTVIQRIVFKQDYLVSMSCILGLDRMQPLFIRTISQRSRKGYSVWFTQLYQYAFLSNWASDTLKVPTSFLSRLIWSAGKRELVAVTFCGFTFYCSSSWHQRGAAIFVVSLPGDIFTVFLVSDAIFKAGPPLFN